MKQLHSKWNNRRHPAPNRKNLEAFCRRAALLAGLGLPEDWLEDKPDCPNCTLRAWCDHFTKTQDS